MRKPAQPEHVAKALGGAAATELEEPKKRRARDEITHVQWFPGQMLGRYQVQKLLGDGTFGRVLEARDESNRTVAVKVIRDVKKYVEAAKIEAQVLKRMHQLGADQGTVKLLETFTEGSLFCLAFEPLGSSLYDLLKANKYRGFFMEDVQKFVHQIFAALAAIHKIRLTHTDLKPENVLLVHPETKLVEWPRGQVKKMIDDMVVLLGKQQKEDEKQKAYCEDEFEKAADEEAATKTKLTQTDATLAEMTDTIGTLMEEISGLTASIAALDKSVADATEQRKEEHAAYVEQMQMNEAAMGLVEKSKNRIQKFYNPTLYKAAPKTEATMEEKIITAGTFAQVHMHVAVAPPPPPETFSGGVEKKTEKAGGVLALMDKISGELEADMKDAGYAEKTAQKEYGELMADSQAA